MATYSLANERLRALEDIEREIGAILQNAGTVILELSKEKTNERLLDRQAAAFTASVQHVEAELSAQIRYLTQVCVWWDVLRGPPSPQLSVLAFTLLRFPA